MHYILTKIPRYLHGNGVRRCALPLMTFRMDTMFSLPGSCAVTRNAREIVGLTDGRVSNISFLPPSRPRTECEPKVTARQTRLFATSVWPRGWRLGYSRWVSTMGGTQSVHKVIIVVPAQPSTSTPRYDTAVVTAMISTTSRRWADASPTQSVLLHVYIGRSSSVCCLSPFQPSSPYSRSSCSRNCQKKVLSGHNNNP